MDKLFSYIGKIATVITIIGGVVAIYFAFYEKRIKIDVQTSIAENLTSHKTIQDLSVRYYYQDSLEVDNLWRMQWVIRNIGDKTIVGTGSECQLLNEKGLPFHFSSNAQILSLNISNCNNNAILQNDCIQFQQWRKGEYVEIVAFIESDVKPEIRISDRDVVDSEISYSKYTPETISSKNSIIELLPAWLSKTLFAIYLALAAFTVLACITSLFTKGVTTASKIGLTIILAFMLIPLLWLIQI